jgi:hypothetical protein
MSLAFPAGIRLNHGQRPVGGGLHPPHSASGEQHDPLAGPCANDATLNLIEFVWTSFAGGRKFGKFNRRFDAGLRRLATAEQNAKKPEASSE